MEEGIYFLIAGYESDCCPNASVSRLNASALFAWLHPRQVLVEAMADQSANKERFNRMFREDVCDQHLFSNLDEVRETTHW